MKIFLTLENYFNAIFRHSPFRQHKTKDKHEIDRMTMTMVSVNITDYFIWVIFLELLDSQHLPCVISDEIISFFIAAVLRNIYCCWKYCLIIVMTKAQNTYEVQAYTYMS